MSETIGNPASRPGTGQQPASTTIVTAGGRVEAAQEAYSFACLNCGYGWEQDYEIEHHTDREGRVTCRYRANGVRVPSPLLKPSCPGCGGHTVRIMRAGRVAAVGQSWSATPVSAPTGPATGPHRRRHPQEQGGGAHLDEQAERSSRYRLHLPSFLSVHRRQGPRG